MSMGLAYKVSYILQGFLRMELNSLLVNVVGRGFDFVSSWPLLRMNHCGVASERK